MTFYLDMRCQERSVCGRGIQFQNGQITETKCVCHIWFIYLWEVGERPQHVGPYSCMVVHISKPIPPQLYEEPHSARVSQFILIY